MWLQQNAHTCHIDINDFRSYYETAIEHIEGQEHDNVPAEVKAECVRLGQVVTVQVYPITPIGFHRIVHYDLDLALGMAVDACRRDGVAAPPAPNGKPTAKKVTEVVGEYERSFEAYEFDFAGIKNDDGTCIEFTQIVPNEAKYRNGVAEREASGEEKHLSTGPTGRWRITVEFWAEEEVG